MSYNSFATYAKRLKEQSEVRSISIPNAQSLYYRDKVEDEEEEKNKGGFLGGLGYFFEKIGAGFMQGVEGIVDYTVGGVAEFFGADEFAEDVFESDWMNYNHADDWYNPSEGWRVAGDVAGGIGSSLPGITAGVAVTLASGGTMAATGVGLVTSGLAAAGTSTKEAFMESGELGGKEFGYGAMMGAVEAGTEALSGALGAGLGKSIKAVGTTFGKTAGRVAGKTVGKTVGKTAAKAATKGVQSLTLKSVAKQAGKEFLSEAFEEGFAEIVSPYAKRLTYDPNAKSATVEEVLYAATIGGISGVLMGGARGGFTQAVNNVRGNSTVKQGGEAEVMALAKQMIDDDAGGEYTPAIKQIYERLSPTIESGAELTGEQRRALGELKTYETANIMQGAAARSAIAAVNGADAIAARLNADGRYKIVDGKFTFVEDASTIKKGATVREITAEDITSGYDANDKSSIYKALKSNDVLRYVASADAAGRFIMSAKEVESAALAGNKIRTQADLNKFIETASDERKAAVGAELGITDWNTLNIDGLNEKISAYRESGKAEAYKQKIAKIDEIKAKAESKARSIPKAIAISDGAVQRYADADSNIAVARTGESFIIYDYTSGNVSKDMTRAEVNAALARYRQATEAASAPAAQTSTESTATNEAAAEVKSENASTNENLSSEAKNSQNGTEIEIKDEKISKSEAEAKEFDALATEKVKGYDKLSAADKSMIRKIFREARATGISEADALSYARVAARTGLDIQFNKQECYKGKNEAGEDVYHAGFYDPENNRIVVNPETNKKHTVLLIHELSHAMRSYLTKGGEYKYFIDKDAKVSKELWDEIKKYYADENGKLDAELALDEASAYYAEALYGTEGAIDLLLGEKPTLKQKILSFFAKSAEYYSTDEKLSREARRHFKKFKAMFDSFAARNQARSAEAGAVKTVENAKVTEKSIEERDTENKKKFSWLKKARKRSVLYYGKDVRMLSDGAFGIVATEEEISFARLEYGEFEHTTLPEKTAAILDNATTPVTEAPMSGKNGNESVYVFNFDGKQFAYNKELLSKFDGNTFYSGDINGQKILKAVDSDGKFVGFLLPQRVNGEIKITGSSRLKSFSKTATKNAETASKPKRAPKADVARRGVVRLVTNAHREALRGAAVKNGMQYISDGNFAARYTDVIDGITEVSAEEYPFVSFDRAIKGVENTNESERIEINSDEIRQLVPTKKSDYSKTIAKIGDSYYQLHYVSKLLDSLSNPKVYVQPGALKSLYFKSDNGEAILLPLKFDESNAPAVVYEAGYVNKNFEAKSARRAAMELDNSGDIAYNKLNAKNAKEIKNGSTDTEVLGRSKISTVGGSDNVVGKQNKNTRTLKGLLGLSDEQLQRLDFKAGDSEWLENYQGELGYGDSQEKQRVRRFLQRFRGKLSRTELRDTDTVGRKLPPDVLKNFSETVFKTKGGIILSLWHWTNKQFVHFDIGDIGFHVGTFDASYAIMFDKSENGEKGYFKELYINSKKPLFIDRDLGINWTPHLTAVASNVLSEREISIINALDGHNIQKYNSAASIRLREMLKNKGYDSIVYTNDFEGGLSVIVFDDNQIYTVAENGVDLTENSQDEAKSVKRYSSETIENVAKSRFTEPDVKFSEKIKAKFTSVKDKLYIDAVDEMWGIEKYLKEKGGVKDYAAVVQQVRASETIAQTMIGVAQYDITESGKGKRLGDGITKIFKKYRVRKIEADFNDYLLHQLNVDRMTLRERSLEWQDELLAAYSKAQADFNRAEALVKQGKAKHIPRGIRKALTAAKKAYESFEVLENKPVFGANEKRAKDITADESRKIIEEYEKEHPEFKKSAEEVWAYLRNLQEMRVKGGLISQESADVMAKYYPHYVPSFRDTTKAGGAGVVKNESQLAVKSTIKSAKGGSEDIYDIEESIAVQTMQTVKAIKMNQLARAVYDAAQKSGDTTYVLTREAAEERANADPDDDVTVDLTPKNNQVVFFLDGKKVEMNVSEDIFAGFKGVNDGSVPKSILWKAASKVLGGFKNLVTQYSPTFAVRNFIRDMQDAYINTKYPKKFLKSIPFALKDMVNNSAEWQLYLAYGGFASTVFDTKGFTNGVGNRGFEAFRQISGIDENDFKKMGKALKNVLTAVGNANAFIEQLTRFTEFKASLAAGDSVEVAINNSAEVTTNFSRHGKTVKVLNATVIPFLNASVQGFDKLLRVLAGPYRERSLAALGILLVKIIAIGIAPQILNMIMNGDDEDYENLTNEVKENYFLIKAGDEFIKIPRGRAAGAFGGIANRLRNVSRGEDFEFLDYLESLERNVTPIDSISRDIFSPFRDVASNTTWYGGEIEGRQFEGVRPGQRFDESTSEIAKWIGEKINYSPKKIHYLIDQYSGVIGDILLPATTAKAEKGYLASNFLLDPATNNKLSNEFYELYDEAQYSKNEGNVTAIYQLKHLNDVKSSVSELYDEITKIQQSDKSNSEKLQEVRTIRILINNLYKTAKTDYAAYTKAIEATDGVFDDADAGEQRIRHAVITQKMYGSEKALKEYNTDVYAKSQLFKKAGVSYDSYYTYYFATKGIQSDLDKDGEVIAGSKRKKVIKAITDLELSRQETLLLIAASGYKINDGDVRGVSASAAKNMLLRYILGMNATKAEKEALAEACGFKVKGGKILKD